MRSVLVLVGCCAALLLTSAVSAQTGTGDRDCRDFRSWAEAQTFFEAAGPGDPHHLDTDHDGIACETLPGAPGREPTSGPSSPRTTSTPRPRESTLPRTTPATPRSTRPSGNAGERAAPTATPRLDPPPPTSPTPVSTPDATPATPELEGPPEVRPPAYEPPPPEPQVPIADPQPPEPLPAEPTPPGRLLLGILEAVILLGPTGEPSGMAEPGMIFLVCAQDGGRVAVAVADDCAVPSWVELGPSVRLHSEPQQSP